MAVTLWNPTDEKLVGKYDGANTVLEPNAKVRVDTPRANHILTQLESRGLVVLEYGDSDEVLEEKKKDALRRQEKFEKLQIRRYNLDNEKRKRAQKMWVDPPKQVEQFAIKWSVPLVEYWSAEDAKAEAMAEAMNNDKQIKLENQELKAQIAEMSDMVRELMADKIEKDKLATMDGRTKEAKELKEKLSGLKKEE